MAKTSCRKSSKASNSKTDSRSLKCGLTTPPDQPRHPISCIAPRRQQRPFQSSVFPPGRLRLETSPVALSEEPARTCNARRRSALRPSLRLGLGVNIDNVSGGIAHRSLPFRLRLPHQNQPVRLCNLRWVMSRAAMTRRPPPRAPLRSQNTIFQHPPRGNEGCAC
jgi:hypothetical protein